MFAPVVLRRTVIPDYCGRGCG